jgi:hypothetical protein
MMMTMMMMMRMMGRSRRWRRLSYQTTQVRAVAEAIGGRGF